MYLEVVIDSPDAIPALPDFDFFHLIFSFFPSLDVLFSPINMAFSIRAL